MPNSASPQAAVRAADARIFQQPEGERLGERGHGERAGGVNGRMAASRSSITPKKLGDYQGHRGKVVAAGER